MKQQYRLSLDDNILLFRDLARARPASLFDNPYLRLLQTLHARYGTKIQLNIYYRDDDSGFTLAEMPDAYKAEWQQNADWLRLSFHAFANEPAHPYANAGYAQLLHDCTLVQNEIIRFAGAKTLSCSTTLHYCTARCEGCAALFDCGVRNLVGLFFDTPCYHLPESVAAQLQTHAFVTDEATQLRFFANDLVLNNISLSEIEAALASRSTKPFLELMIHEQYFYSDYFAYQPDFADKLHTAVQWAAQHGFEPAFLEELA